MMLRRAGGRMPRARSVGRIVLLPLAGAIVLAALDRAADGADIKINPPSMEQGDVSIEDNSAIIAERGRSRDSAQTHFAELGYGITDYWWAEVEGHWETGANGLKFRTVDFENAFRLVPQEGPWPETALFLEYDRATDARSPEGATVGALLRKDFGPSTTVLNLLLDHEFGRNQNSGTRLRCLGSSTWQVVPEFAPGIQFFDAPGKVLSFERAGAQDHRVGPLLAGAVELEGKGELGYNLAYLFGLTPAAPRGTLVWRLEYDIHF
jgi:hypothetical protein